MAGFSQTRRQRIIDGYLAESGRNTFRPGEFIDWLADKPEHEAYAAFYSLEDAEAARAYRIELARRFVSGLRVTVTESTEDDASRKVTVSTHQAPAFMSPMDGRAKGGGYVAYDPNDPESVSMFRHEAHQAFGQWVKRYETALTPTERKTAKTLLETLAEEIAAPA